MIDLPIRELPTDRASWYWRALHVQNALRYELVLPGHWLLVGRDGGA